jgi:hypothetical protein
MVSVATVWLPILLSAVIVFIASSILHMALPIHKSDYRKLPDEDAVLNALRAAGVTPGRVYHFPFTTHKEMKSPQAIERFKRGPVGLLTVIPSGAPAMGKYLGLWFGYCLVISAVVGCLAAATHGAGADYHGIFHFGASTAFLAYGVAQLQDSIWKAQTWGVTFKHVFDGLIYALLTALTFAWLWPK